MSRVALRWWAFLASGSLAMAAGSPALASGNDVDAGTVREVVVAGLAGVPADASAVVLNVTAVSAVGAGFVTIFPCGQAQPYVSNLNLSSGSTVANTVIVRPGTGNRICIATSSDVSADFLVDVSGWFAADGSVWLATPTRVLSTRDGLGTVKAKLNPGSVLRVPLAGAPSGTTAAVLNVTATNTEGDGFLTVYPCGDSAPTVSSLNFRAGQTVPNSVVVAPGQNGDACALASVATDVIVDQSGWLTSDYAPLPAPSRVLDTRNGIGAPVAQLRAGVEYAQAMPASPVPSAAAVVNLTVTRPNGPGFLTVYPCGVDTPATSNLNFTTEQTIANLAVTGVATTHGLCLRSSADADVLVDLSGWLAGNFHPLAAPVRLADTRSCSAFLFSVTRTASPGVPRSQTTIYSHDLLTGAQASVLSADYDPPTFVSSYGRTLVGHDCYVYGVQSATSGNAPSSHLLQRADLQGTGTDALAGLAADSWYDVLAQDSSDGSLLLGVRAASSASTATPHIERRDEISGRLLQSWQLGAASQYAVSNDGRVAYFLTPNAGNTTETLTELDLATGAHRVVSSVVPYASFGTFEVAPDGRTLLRSASGLTPPDILIDVATGAMRPAPSVGTDYRYLPDGRLYFSPADGTNRILAVQPDGSTVTILVRPS